MPYQISQERQVERETRKKTKTERQMFRQSKAGGSRTTVGTNIMARGQGNQTRSITQPTSNTERTRAPYCQTCGHSHYERCWRAGVCFKCGQPGHMKRGCPLNVSRPTYDATAPSSVVASAHTTGSVAQPVGKGTSSRGAQSGMRGQTAGGRGQAKAFVLNPQDT